MYAFHYFVPFPSFEMEIMDPNGSKVCSELVLMNTNLTGQSMKYVLKIFFIPHYSFLKIRFCEVEELPGKTVILCVRC